MSVRVYRECQLDMHNAACITVIGVEWLSGMFAIAAENSTQQCEGIGTEGNAIAICTLHTVQIRKV